MSRQLNLKDMVESVQREIERLAVELTEERSRMSVLKVKIIELQRAFAYHEAKAMAKTRALATSTDELQAIVPYYNDIINFDCVVEDRKLGEEEARLQNEREKMKNHIDEFISSHDRV